MALEEKPQGARFTDNWTVEHPIQRDVLLRCAKPGITINVRLLPEQSTASGRLAIAGRNSAQVNDMQALNIVQLASVLDDSIARRERSTTSQPTSAPVSPKLERGLRSLITNEVLSGEPLWVLDDDELGGVLVKSSTGYTDWTFAASVRFVTEPEFVAAMNPPRSAETLSRIDRAIAHAKARLGQPYIWGGRGATGADCSGLTQTAFAAAGIHIPRDADQQSVVGKLVATRWFRDALQSGDLLFFLSAKRGDVNHVAIYLGDNRYIESADGGVKIRSMDPADPTYDAKRMKTFAWARRVLE